MPTIKKLKVANQSKNAPTYVKEETAAPSTSAAARYVCSVCGYVYDPAKGDPDGGIAPGTKFEDIPDSWVCPVCGADKSKFEKKIIDRHLRTVLFLIGAFFH